MSMIRRVKDFDEAHMSVDPKFAPILAQALQRVGYHVTEDYLQTTPNIGPVQIILQSSTAKQPKLTQNMKGFYLPMDVDSCTIEPGATKLIQTGLSIGTLGAEFGEIKQVLNKDLPHLQLFQGLIKLNGDKEIHLVLHNNGTENIVLTGNENIAILNLPTTTKINSTIVPYKPMSSKQQSKHKMKLRSNTTSNLNINNARAAKLEASLQVSLDLPYDLSMSSDPYNNHTHRVISLASRSPTLGMKIEQCTIRNLPILKSCSPGTPSAKIPDWRTDLKNAYITQINDTPVKTRKDIMEVILACKLAKLQDVSVKFSTMDKQNLHPQHGVPQIYHDQLAIIAQHIFDIQHLSGTGVNSNDMEVVSKLAQQYDDNFSHHVASMKLNELLHQDKILNSQWKWYINKVKRKHNTFTLGQLKKREDWEEWNASIFKQLDQYYDQSTFSEPQPLPKGANLLSLCWVYLIKLDGLNTKKSRCVCNGSPKFRGTVTLAETYASSLDQTGAKMFWASAAINNFIVLGADASNAFAEAPPPKAPLYVRIDDNFKRWYKHKFPNRPNLPDDYVLRVQKALQGHPESPRLWAELIDKIIIKLNLQPCTHEKCLYFTDNYNNTNKRVVFLRQVDDFAIACEDRELAKQVIKDINSKMTIDVKELGVVQRYNGVDIQQTREYIKLHNTTYIDKLIATHQWLQNDDTPVHAFPLPMNPDVKYQHKLEQAEPLELAEKLQLEKKLGFTYRQAIGEIIYAMITCRPDVSYSIIKLSQYSTRPAAIHFNAVLHLYRYLKATKTDGIYYWREHEREDLPHGAIPDIKSDINYDEDRVSTRQTDKKDILMAYVDSDHASDASHRRSVSGFHVKLAGGTVLYKTKYQNIVAQSSTEVEFIAAAEAGKYILYLRTIMEQIGLPQHHATIMYEDNQGALLMAQAGQPTKRTKHIDTRYFALQSWVERDLLSFKRITTSDNSADAMTKATARTLFYRHNNHIMGKIIPRYVHFLQKASHKMSTTTGYHIHRFAQNIFSTYYNRYSSVQGGML